MYSDSVTQWDNPILLQEPRYSWEFTQIGNCGSQFGLQNWLVITHGVGAMRRYCIGASLDLDDPSKEIGRLKEPYFPEKMNGRDMYPM
jgi:predicted GH43/DUF377 family glycosyl hydrolase